MVQLTIFNHWFRKCLGTDQATSHYLNQWWLEYWRIYASRGLNELSRNEGEARGNATHCSTRFHTTWQHSLYRWDVITRPFPSWWRHQMETFSALLTLCAGNSTVTGEFPLWRPVKRSFDVFLIYTSTNGWINSRDSGYLRRHRAHYDVSVMWYPLLVPHTSHRK